MSPEDALANSNTSRDATALELEHRVLLAATACGRVRPEVGRQEDAIRVAEESRVWPEA